MDSCAGLQDLVRVVSRPDQPVKSNEEEEGTLAPETSDDSSEEEAEGSAEESSSEDDGPEELNEDETAMQVDAGERAKQLENGHPSTSMQVCLLAKHFKLEPLPTSQDCRSCDTACSLGFIVHIQQLMLYQQYLG